MLSGGKKYDRVVKTKYKKASEDDSFKSLNRKQKHHDKSFYRLQREEKKEYSVA